MVCSSNLKQLALLYNTYGVDYDDYINPAYMYGPTPFNGVISGHRGWFERIVHLDQYSPAAYTHDQNVLT